MEPWIERERMISVLGTWDVAVCGAGPAGCAAAIAAARAGARTVLIEREGFPGGAPAAQLVVPILSTNGTDFQGLWHDLARELLTLDGLSPLTRQRNFIPHRNATADWIVGSMHPEAVKIAWDRLLERAGVRVLPRVLVADVLRDGAALRGIAVETKRGRMAIRATCVVDATGDGDVAARAGVPFDQGIAGRPWANAVGLMALTGGVPPADDDIAGRGRAGFGRTLGPCLHTRLSGMMVGHSLDPLDEQGVGDFMRESREKYWKNALALRANPGMESVFPLLSAGAPGIRSSRRVHGVETVTDADAWSLRQRPHGIAKSSWLPDVHCPERATTSCDQSTCPFDRMCMWDTPAMASYLEKVRDGAWFDIPYGALVPVGMENLLVAGRCISGEHMAQSSFRIQQTCLSIGEATGMAAAEAVAAGVTPGAVDAKALAEKLARAREVEPACAFPDGPPEQPFRHA